MPSSRRFREGSVGLLILVGLGLFGATVLWLRGVGLGKDSYKIVAEFPSVAGMQVGAPVRYRGVKVGRITTITPGTNGVDVEIVISPADLVIPNQVLIEANQGGLIGETSIDITPLQPLPPQAINAADPLARNCNTDVVICNRERLQGRIGVNFDELIRGSIRFTNLFSDPTFFNNLNALVKNTTVASAEITQLTREINQLTQSVERELGIFSNAAVESASALQNAAGQIGATANQFGAIAREVGATTNQFGTIAGDIRATANQISATANQVGMVANEYGAIAQDFSATANEISATANQIGQTAGDYGAIADELGSAATQVAGTVDRLGGTVEGFSDTANELNLTAQNVRTLVSDVSALVDTNRDSLVTTLENINQTSEQLRFSAESISPLISQVEQELNQIENSALFDNLETLSVNASQLAQNAAIASENLAQFTTEVTTPTNLVLLQQTLDSARATFQNAQKITSDLEQFTGDPALRETIELIIEILGELLSSTEELERQTQMAIALDPLTDAVNQVSDVPVRTQGREEPSFDSPNSEAR
ncbi:MlaD family protein [Phormidium sp. CCY1219]|uniref:MlaD family protein n=1 Tax=Phormidium sp. CCY1219 TaxID=2886104 RepID=UPI002D1F7DDD|nr:MlaD family protein [Phormidium sp. CCY1219]MEB3829414.1 MlaD family protein [Phormidium sp. CCY1219]